MEKVNFKQSLEELENDYWPDSDLEKYEKDGVLTSLETNVYAYRKIPLNEIKPEQIRLLIGQDIGVNFLLPLALNILIENPFFECTFYEGDLLNYVSGIEKEYWINNKELYNQFCNIMEIFNKELEKKREEIIEIYYDASGFDKEMKEINDNWYGIKKTMETIISHE